MDKIFGIARFSLEPGQTDAFVARARETMAAALTDLDGTQAYEWFLSPAGDTCIVVEIYDGAPAVAHHGRCVGHTIPPLLEHVGGKQLALLGDVPAEMLERMSGRFGAVENGGKRFLGRLSSPAPGRVGGIGAEMILAVAHFAIRPGNEAAFRDLAGQCHAAVEAREPGTIGYEWFMDESGTRCTTIDIYRDVGALKDHMANAGALMSRILELVDSEVELFGAVPAAMSDRFKEGLGTRFFGPRFQGIL